MKTGIIAALLCALPLVHGVSAGDCDCKKYPFKPNPPCFAKCWSALLRHSNSGTLQRALELDPEVASKVAGKSLETSKKALSTGEYESFLEKLGSASESDVNALGGEKSGGGKKPQAEKKDSDKKSNAKRAAREKVASAKAPTP